MPSRNWKLVFVLVAGLVACGEAPADRSNGWLDVVIRPDSMAASGRPLRGSFLLHGLGPAVQARIDIDAHGYLMRRVPLAAGSYALEWQPSLDLATLSGSDPAGEELRRELTTELRVPLTVAAGRVTTLNVRSTLGATPSSR
ncbi:MAG TPA: hypothetical protein VJU61_25535, partial [Polyangiaceae bacterium]|nr:hypothetical protein [Polyangiaceae bacterium]